MKIRFSMDRVVQDLHAGTNREIKYNVGQVIDLPDASAYHWIARGAAEPHEEKARAKSQE